jgi:hypothetical protein
MRISGENYVMVFLMVGSQGSGERKKLSLRIRKRSYHRSVILHNNIIMEAPNTEEAEAFIPMESVVMLSGTTTLHRKAAKRTEPWYLALPWRHPRNRNRNRKMKISQRGRSHVLRLPLPQQQLKLRIHNRIQGLPGSDGMIT